MPIFSLYYLSFRFSDQNYPFSISFTFMFLLSHDILCNKYVDFQDNYEALHFYVLSMPSYFLLLSSKYVVTYPVDLMFVVPYILVTCFYSIPTERTICFISFLKIFSSTCFGSYLHPSSGAQLQCTAIVFFFFGVFYSIEPVLVLGHFDTLARSKCPNTSIARAEPDDPCAETRFRLSEKRTSPFESAGVSAQSAGRRLCVNIVS
jgi:hypothetical protein